ncbi:MAG: hypothetical protein LBE95_00260, partial [Holosporaceae bacterium]|nr:hypothetical protein [Holosporaceae bacterium]
MMKTTKFIAIALTSIIYIMPQRCQAAAELPPLPLFEYIKPYGEIHQRFYSIAYAIIELGSTDGNFRALSEKYPAVRAQVHPGILVDIDTATGFIGSIPPPAPWPDLAEGARLALNLPQLFAQGGLEKLFWEGAFGINRVVVSQSDHAQLHACLQYIDDARHDPRWWPSIARVVAFLDRAQPSAGLQ